MNQSSSSETASPLSVIREITECARDPQRVNEGRDRLIRFLNQHGTRSKYTEITNSLCVIYGLYPYIETSAENLSTAEAIAYEFHRKSFTVEREDIFFHEEQAKIFHRLMKGENIILSAPTSFGKSIILDAIIDSGRWRNIVVIVPTVALIDEVRRRASGFNNRYTIITHPRQRRSLEGRNLYILTQERFMEIHDIENIDFFMIDEFYKLDSTDSIDSRATVLNIAWERLRSTGAQYYLTGPNIDSLASSLDQGLHDELITSSFKTVSVDIDDRSSIPDDARLSDLESYLPQLEGSTLIFVSAPQRAEKMALQISHSTSTGTASNFTIEVANWLSSNFHPEWRPALALHGNVGIHTGPMPRSIQRLMVRLFEEGHIDFLVCTSTLIEGVNTTAKTVIIYDKKISRKKIDFFTFKNIQGRAGRLKRHYIGKVITYMPPPPEESTEINIPIESQNESVPLASIIHLPSDKLSTSSRERLSPITCQNELSIETIKRNIGFDPVCQIEAAKFLRDSPHLRRLFRWSAIPAPRELEAVLSFAYEKLNPSMKNSLPLRRMLGMLQAIRQTNGDLKALVERQESYKRSNQTKSDILSDIFNFQRNWMGFTIPSTLKACERIYNEVANSFGEPRADYSFYISHIESLFLPQTLIDLDEYGLPLPLALKLEKLGIKRGQNIDETIDNFIHGVQSKYIQDSLTPVERWILDDVLTGLGAASSL